MRDAGPGPERGQPPLPALDPNAARKDTWRPDTGTALDDGHALHKYLFAGGDLRRLRRFVTPSTRFVVAGPLAAIDAWLPTAGDGDVLRILDYGAGTGLAAIELLKACRERRVEEQLERRGARLELHLLDLPTPWFAQGFALLGNCAWTRFHSMTTPGGSFRPLLEITGGHTMDAVMVANVFHLIPRRALSRAAAELASVSKPGGRLTWCSPDLAPAGARSVLLHDSNRALRKRWLEVLVEDAAAAPDGAGGPLGPAPPVLLEAAARARESLDRAARRKAQRRADNHFLAEANTARDVATALEDHFSGQVERPTCEALDEDILRALLVPSNQAEYLAEIRDRSLREAVIRELMLKEVLPGMAERGARTASGLNVQWSLGSFVRRPAPPGSGGG